MSEKVEKVKLTGLPVFIVTSYHTIYGVFEKFEDASQVVATYLAKGQLCDISSQIIM